jgi:hypothetical protein
VSVEGSEYKSYPVNAFGLIAFCSFDCQLKRFNCAYKSSKTVTVVEQQSIAEREKPCGANPQGFSESHD